MSRLMAIGDSSWMVISFFWDSYGNQSLALGGLDLCTSGQDIMLDDLLLHLP